MSPETRLGLTVGLGGLTAVLDTTVAVLAVPALVRGLDAPLSTVQWVTTAYVLALVAVMPLAAAIGARFGFRRTYVSALVVFATGSALAGLAPGAGSLIAARALQGLGGGLVNPVGTTLALREVPSERRGRVTSLLGLPLLAGPLLGPVVAGALLDTLGWRAIFFITVPPALLTILLVGRFAPPDPPGRPVLPDLTGAALLLPGAVAMVWAVGEATAPPVLRSSAAVLGAGLVAVFVRRSWWTPVPLLRVRLLGDRAFARAAAVLTLFAAAYFGSMLLTPTYVQAVRGDPAVVAGTLAMVAGLATGLSAQVATRLVDRVPARRVVAAGLGLGAASLLGGALVLRVDTPYVVVGALAALLGLGSGAVLLPTMTTATRELDGEALASGSTILALLSQLATALGTAAVTAGYAAAVTWCAPSLEGGVAGLDRLGAAARTLVLPGVVDAQRIVQAASGVLVIAALVLVPRLGTRGPRPNPRSGPRPSQKKQKV